MSFDDDIVAAHDAINIIKEYYSLRRRMIDLSKNIAASYPSDTRLDIMGMFRSNHVHDYFEADKEARRTPEGGMSFSEYYCDVLDMDEPCQDCARVLNMIRGRRSLALRLGVTKNKIMRLGKIIAVHAEAGK